MGVSRRETIESAEEVGLHVGVGVLLHGQRCGRMGDEGTQQTVSEPVLIDEPGQCGGDVGKAGAARHDLGIALHDALDRCVRNGVQTDQARDSDRVSTRQRTGPTIARRPDPPRPRRAGTPLGTGGRRVIAARSVEPQGGEAQGPVGAGERQQRGVPVALLQRRDLVGDILG